MVFTVLVIGESGWRKSESVIRKALRVFQPQMEGLQVRVMHSLSGAVAGYAGKIAKELGYEDVVVKADWEKYPAAAFKFRNQQMVDLLPDVVYAFHRNLARSVDTKDCVTRALKAGLVVFRYGEEGGERG